MLPAALLVAVLAVAPGPPKMVFAHYMVACPTAGGGATVADYQAEIRAAQSRGIDGFALNCGGWTAREPHYKQRTLRIYEAAQALGSDFKLFLSADYCCGLTLAETRDMIDTFAGHPNQFRVNGRPLLSTFAGEGADNTAGRELLAFLDGLGGAAGRPVVFVPYFYPRPNITEHPTAAHVAQTLATFPTLDGFFYFGAAGSSAQLAAANRACGEGWRGASKLFMAGLTPYYRGLGGNYRCFETRGLQGLAQQWETAIAVDATWVELVTWNDWGEASYVAPFGGPADTALWNGHWGELLSHVGYLDGMRYWIDWFKSGQPPAITADRLFYCYRPHLRSAAGRRTPADPTPARPGGADQLADSVFLTAFLTAPAQLRVQLGEQATTFDLPAGVQHREVTLTAGTPRFELWRGPQQLWSKVAEHAVRSDSAFGNFNTFCGQAP
ncbi:MAG: hypothetical protein IT204_20705 [Fimbriimonadaceae bacterium]|nr:hypothetical protein [Fimbriimonadaceae bacterium]